MTASSISGDAGNDLQPEPGIATGLRRLYQAAIGYTAVSASHRVDRLTRRLNSIAEPHGATGGAVVEGVKATIVGDNPVWAAVKGAWRGADGKVKAATLAVLLLMLLLSPVLLLVLLLAALVAAAVLGVRAALR
jgi:ABC-type antimicrobial peptide transport system permease subunit